MFSKILRCDKCGEEKAVGRTEVPLKKRLHSCGGSFSEDRITCPDCKSASVVVLEILGFFD